MFSPKGQVSSVLAERRVHPDYAARGNAADDRISIEPIEERYSSFVVVNPKNEPSSTRAQQSGEPLSIPAWRLNPATKTRPPASEDELFGRINKYFRETIESGRSPTFNDLAGQTGFSSFYAFVNSARRAPPAKRHAMARSITAIGAFLEDEARAGSRNALELLRILPGIDSDDHNATPHRSFAPNQPPVAILNLNSAEHRGSDLSPQEAYQKLIQAPTYEEMRPVLDVELTENGDFEVVDLPE